MGYAGTDQAWAEPFREGQGALGRFDYGAAIDAFVAPRPDALSQLDDENLLDVELRQSYVEEVVGDDNPKGVTAVRARHVDTGEITEIPCKGFFVAIGHAPATELVKDQLEMHNGGYVKVQPGTTKTSTPGVFAAGDLTDHVYRQAVTSAGMGCMAALDAEKWLAEQEGEPVTEAGAYAAETPAAE